MANGVYCLTSPSGKRYVGVGVHKSGYGIEIRWSCYRGLHCKNQRFLYHALKKYGHDNFKFEIILETNNKKRALKIEKKLIKEWNLQNDKYGYNLSSGGERPNHSEETRLLISQVQKGKKRGPHSEETRKKISEANKGNTSALGHKQSEEHRQKISESHKGIIPSEEVRKKMSEVHKGKKASEETRRKMSESQKVRWRARKAA